MNDPEIEFVDVTPQMAREWLATDQSNRKLKKGAVAANARDMKAGKWNMTGEPIKFDTEGRLIDGQHRLQAVVQAEVPVRMMIVHGLEPETRLFMDTGVKRSAADMLHMSGTNSAFAAAAGVRLGLLVESGTNRTPTHHEIAQFVEDHPDFPAAADKAMTYVHIPLLPSVKVYVFWRLNQVDSEASSKFFYSLNTITGMLEGDARLSLLRKMANVERPRSMRGKLYTVALTFAAWNAWRNRQALERIPVRYAEDGKLRVPELF